ncbi:MAG: response regulator [Chloroflexi bacterium]|nr:response regulator [Chloroflexota bacterium]
MPRIVVAEDDPDIRAIIESTLKFRGYEVVAARDGQQGWQLIQAEMPDAAILDMDMPVMTGVEVCRRLRADPATRHIPVLFLTGHEELEAKAEAFEAGADDYLVKPFAPRELTMRLSAVLKRSESARASVPAIAAPSIVLEGRVIGVFGAKGGVGASALAVNLAVALAQSGGKVCLVDLDLEHATDNMLLDLIPRPQATIVELATEFGLDLGWDSIATCLLPHKSGVSVLPGPLTPAQAELVTGPHVKVYLDQLRRHHSHVVVDLVSAFREINLDTFGMCDRVLLVTSPELPALKSLRGAADVLKQLGIPQAKQHVVVNQTASRVNVSLEDVKRAVGLPVIAAIPHGGDEFTDALNRGIPMVQWRPQHATSVAIRKLAEALIAAPRPASRPLVR